MNINENIHVIIIGNGFDIAHELRTSYKYFLEDCMKKHNSRIPPPVKYDSSFIDNIWYRHFYNQRKILPDKWLDLENEIYEVIKAINIQLINITSNYKISSLFSRTYTMQKDYISENFNLRKIINDLKKSEKIYETDKKEYIVIQTNYFDYLSYYFYTYKGFINFLYEQLREFTKEFEKYLLKEVLANINSNSKYNLSLKNSGIEEENKDVYVLSFNYTDTFKKLYDPKICSYCKIKDLKPIYIHGKASGSDVCNLVLGTHSFYNYLPNDLKEEINVCFNVFKKHNQRHKYSTIEHYQDLIRKLNKVTKNSPVFHIIGHSLNKSDHNILKHLLNANKNSVINVYYHDEEAQERLINNITKIIGEEEVMTRVRFIDQHDENKGILKPKS